MKVRKMSLAGVAIGVILGFQAHMVPFMVGDMNYYPMGWVCLAAFTIFGGAYGHYCAKHPRKDARTPKAGVTPALGGSTNETAKDGFQNPQ